MILEAAMLQIKSGRSATSKAHSEMPRSSFLRCLVTSRSNCTGASKQTGNISCSSGGSGWRIIRSVLEVLQSIRSGEASYTIFMILFPLWSTLSRLNCRWYCSSGLCNFNRCTIVASADFALCPFHQVQRGLFCKSEIIQKPAFQHFRFCLLL